MRPIFTSEVHEPVLPGRQNHGQSRPLHIGQSSQLRVRHSGGLRVREHADLPLVEHHLQDSQSGSNETQPGPPELIRRRSWGVSAHSKFIRRHHADGHRRDSFDLLFH